MRSSTETLIGAMRILANDIQSKDGIANGAIFEAATRLREFDAFRLKIISFANDVADCDLDEYGVLLTDLTEEAKNLA